MAKRSYRQYCALAYALDLVGERWTLLLVRELLTGPKRFTDLQSNLPGIGTNLLASRLRELEEAGLIRRGTLPPPAASAVYELTGGGLRLEHAIVELAEWGLRVMGGPALDEHRRPPWSVLALRALIWEAAPTDLTATFEFRVDGEVLHGRLREATLRIEQGAAWEKPDLVVTADSATLLSVVTGRQGPTQAMASGALHIAGELRARDILLEVMESASTAGASA